MERWDADRALTLETVQVILAAQFPDVDTANLRFLGSGWEFDVYVTGDGWAFRFPRRSGVADIFDFERKVLELVRTVVPDWVAIPRLERFGLSGPRFPDRFVAHRYIPGITADHMHAPPSDALPEQLGTVLGALHAADPQLARDRGVLADTENGADWYEETVGEVPALLGLNPTTDAAVRWVLASPKIPPLYVGPLRIVHNDLCPDHILVDPITGNLTGIIDWTDIALADPMLDFVALATWKGFDFVERVLRFYSAMLDGPFRERLRFAARIRSLHWLHQATQRGHDVAKHIGWVENAFGSPLNSLPTRVRRAV